MSGTPKPIVRWLQVDNNGDVRVFKTQPNYAPGRAVFKLNITLPPTRYMDGTINLDIPEGGIAEPEVEYVEPMESLVESLRKKGLAASGVVNEPEDV